MPGSKYKDVQELRYATTYKGKSVNEREDHQEDEVANSSGDAGDRKAPAAIEFRVVLLLHQTNYAQHYRGRAEEHSRIAAPPYSKTAQSEH